METILSLQIMGPVPILLLQTIIYTAKGGLDESSPYTRQSKSLQLCIIMGPVPILLIIKGGHTYDY